MKQQPILHTKRLRLRPFRIEDAMVVKSLLSDSRVAETTANIPYPYLDGMAEDWISRHKPNWESGSQCVYAITEINSKTLVGAISIIDIANKMGELGYWIGEQYWGRGYCTEACIELVKFGFEHLSLAKIHAHHLSRNPASGRVLLHSGLVHISTKEITFPRSGELETIECYEIEV